MTKSSTLEPAKFKYIGLPQSHNRYTKNEWPDVVDITPDARTVHPVLA
jgi:hypothetical protein